MARITYDQNARVDQALDLVRNLSRVDDPQQVQQVIADGLTQMDPIDGYMSTSRRELPRDRYKITRMMVNGAGMDFTKADPWRDWNLLTIHQGGLLGEIMAGERPVIIHDLDVSSDPILSDRIAKYRSLQAIPLYDQGESLNWMFELSYEPHRYAPEELDQSVLIANMAGTTVRSVRNAQQLRTAESLLRRELERIAALQRALLPHPMPEVPGVSLAASYRTADQAGGDMYDVIPVADTQDLGDVYAVLIADVSGHGPSAAVVMAMLNSILYTYPRAGEGPGGVLEYANQHLCAKRIDQAFVTAFLGGYQPQHRRFTYARAGHNPPLLLTPGTTTRVEELQEVGGLPLGIAEDVAYSSAYVQLDSGQTLLLYTDGITEARNHEGVEFGTERLERVLRASSCSPRRLIDEINTALNEFSGPAKPADDQTLLALQIQ